MATQAIIEQFIYVTMPPHLKQSMFEGHLENGKYEEIAWHLGREIKLSGLEAANEPRKLL